MKKRLPTHSVKTLRAASLRRLITNRRDRVIALAAVSFCINLLYGLYNGILGVYTASLWLLTMGAYYIILGAMRFFAVLYARQNRRSYEAGCFVMKLSGILLLGLTVVLWGSVYLSFTFDTAVRHPLPIMLSIATYTFYKVTMAVINSVKARKVSQPLLFAIRAIGCADAAAALFSLQNSMIASFGNAMSPDSRMGNALTGTAVCLFVLVLAIILIIQSKKLKERHQMEKSKFMEANEKIRDGVVAGYHKIESGVISGYTKLEDKFVARYLTRDGETVEEAKSRLKGEQKQD